MGTGLFTLAEELQKLNHNLHDTRRERVTRTALRAGLETGVGEFKKARRLSEAQTRDLFRGRALLGVDGSVNQVGGNYPYTIHLFKSLAKSTVKQDGGSAVEKVTLFSPLTAEARREIRDYMDENPLQFASGGDLSEQQAFQQLADKRMVELELDAAIKAMERYNPFLVLMDGGFSRLKGKGGDKWEQFEQLALQKDIIIVGVIEEVGSFRLQKRLEEVNSDLLKGFVHRHDREILFGTLNIGEWLKTSYERPIKNEFYTVFTRLSDQPQAGACDFLRDQAEDEELVESILDYLYTITPSKSRGIPLWLDLVDAEVRLTKKQIDLIVKANLDPENIESFLRPQRERRDF